MVHEGSAADLIHEEQDGFVAVPQVLLSQDAHPELQHRCGAHSTGL